MRNQPIVGSDAGEGIPEKYPPTPNTSATAREDL
jgi:hypothetical protein